MATYDIVKIKTFNGREGQGLNATITKDGKAICFVMDDASGGEVNYDFRNPLQTPKSFQATTPEMAAAEEAALLAHCLSILSDADKKELDKWVEDTKSYSPELREDIYRGRWAMGRWVDTFIDEYQTKKRFDRLAKKKTLFRLKGDKPEEWRTLAAPYAQTKDFMAKKYGDAIEQVWGA